MATHFDNNADGTKDPDMEDWRKAFGHNIPVAVNEFLEDRHREWELQMEADLKARQEARTSKRGNCDSGSRAGTQD